MKNRLFITALLLCFAVALQAQDKSEWYYMDHKDEILKDARKLFQKGDYSRAIELCNLHRDLLGDEHSETPDRDALMILVLKCQKLATDIENFVDDGYMQVAKALAEELRALNPSDERLKPFGLYSAPPPEPAQKPEPKPKQEPKPAPEEKAFEEVGHSWADEDDPFYAVRVGCGILGIPSYYAFAPSLSFGWYNIGYSDLGMELKGYYTKALAKSTVQMIGADLLFALHVAKGVYPKLGIGGFSCTDISINNGDNTKGLCIPGGCTFLLGRHFTFDIGVSYYPETKVWQQSNEQATKGVYYKYRFPNTVLGYSVSAWMSIGVAF